MKNLQHYLDQYLLRCLDGGESLVKKLMEDAIKGYFLSQANSESNDRAMAQIRFIYNVIGMEALDAILWAQASDIPTETPDDPYSLLRSLDPGDALEIAIDYIANQDSNDAFRDHVLNSVSSSEPEDEWDDDIIENKPDTLVISTDGRKPDPLPPHLVEPPTETAPQFFKSFYTLEVLSDRPTMNISMAEIVEECDDGDFSGHWKRLSHTRITPHEMAKSLHDQGSSPEFLLGDDAWKYQLKRGDTAAYQPKGSGNRPMRRGQLAYIEHCLDHCLAQWIHGEPILTVNYDELYAIEELPCTADSGESDIAGLDLSEIRELLVSYGMDLCFMKVTADKTAPGYPATVKHLEEMIQRVKNGMDKLLCQINSQESSQLKH